MIFQHTWQPVLDGTKTQTRRIVKMDEVAWSDEFDVEGHPTAITDIRIVHDSPYSTRFKWRIGNTYAVQPGWGQPAVGRIRLTGIRLERVQDITWEDCLAEGISPVGAMVPGYYSGMIDPPEWQGEDAIELFADLWETVHGPGAWDDNPEVWVLEFERVEED